MSAQLSAGTKLGRYEIRSQLGVGGMGEVYLAEDTQLRRRVALKVLPGHIAANQDRMRRFVQEAQAAAALNHPNIAHVYEIGVSDGVIKILEQVVKADPSFAPAFAELARAYGIKAHFFAPDAEKTKLNEDAKFAVEKSLALNPDKNQKAISKLMI